MSCVTRPCFIQEKAKVWRPGLSSHQYKRKQLTAMLRKGVSCSAPQQVAVTLLYPSAWTTANIRVPDHAKASAARA